MKLSLVCLALCALTFSQRVASHKACTYDTVTLKKRAASEDTCREKCSTCAVPLLPPLFVAECLCVDSHPKKGKCFAYTYATKNRKCIGYVIDVENEYTNYEECGTNAGVDISLPDPGDAQPSIESYDGCSFEIVQLGLSFTKEQCEELCTNCKIAGFFLVGSRLDALGCS